MNLINCNPADVTALAELVNKARHNIDASLFREESSDPKYNAQRNLSGRTHYVDDETLRWHKSRVLSCRVFCDGLILRIITSDALDMHNTSRGFRAVAFDVFGTAVIRPDLEHASKTSNAAERLFRNTPFDLLAHYRDAFHGLMQRKAGEVAALHGLFQSIPAQSLAA